jgi:hypothetical protein
MDGGRNCCRIAVVLAFLKKSRRRDLILDAALNEQAD